MTKKIILSIFLFASLMALGIFFFTKQATAPIEPKNTDNSVSEPSASSTSTKVVSLKDELRKCLPFSDMASKQRCDSLIKTISNFDECVSAGFEIQKSNPPKCQTPDGRSFVSSIPQRTTLTGYYICLPKKDTGGPQTEECALGLRTDDNLYYALDTRALQTIFNFPTGTRLKVSGPLTPIEMISTNYWDKYGIRGIMLVTEANEVD